MKNENYFEYFIYITFKIIPKCYRPYKLMTIASLDNDNIKTLLIGFVIFKYMDYISYTNIFNI